MLLWWLTGVPVLTTLWHDARLTAAIVMGSGVLPPPSTARWDVLLVATGLHFALSIAYAVPPVLCAGRLRARWLIVGGGFYGLAIYGVNLYGFTTVFPWFAVSRGWVTVLTHVVFGIALAGTAQLLAAVDRGQDQD